MIENFDRATITAQCSEVSNRIYSILLDFERILGSVDLREVELSEITKYHDILIKYKTVRDAIRKSGRMVISDHLMAKHISKFKQLLGAWELLRRQPQYKESEKSALSVDFRARVDSKNPDSPLFKIIGNEDAISLLSWILFDALHQPGRVCTQNLAFVGPSSAGKTMISRVFAEVLDLPHVEISPKAVNNASDVIKAIRTALGKNFSSLLPPMVILLDESHAFNDNVIQSLLKATERNDATLAADGEILDCRNVCWHFATTDLGKMFDAFITRFERVNLRLYTKDEIAQIIQKKNPDWDKTICMIVANYCNRIPRESLAFADLVKKAYRFNPTTWEEAAAAVAKKKGIDEYGMTSQRLNILRALGQRPMSMNQLCATAGCKEEELKKLVLPWLLESTPDQAPYVVVTNRHYVTKEGLAELDKRKIAHNGDAVLCSADRN